MFDKKIMDGHETTKLWWQKIISGIDLNSYSCMGFRLFGLVTRKDGQMSAKTNQCWLFAEYEDDQPASAIINFARKLTTSFVPFPSNFLGTD